MRRNKTTESTERINAPLERAVSPIAESLGDFINAQSASGWMLLAATLLAIAVANSPWAHYHSQFLHLEFGLSFAGFQLTLTLHHWVNDGLMALFFFMLGLELKRELLVGRLRDPKQALSILFAAGGGMLVPIIGFMLVIGDGAASRGWAIPVATDTAFALALLVLLRDHVPAAARAFLVGLAIVDDLGAILIIALAYTADIDYDYLLPSGLALAVMIFLNLIGVRRGLPYVMAGCALWFCFLQLGLHGTLAGVVVALSAPVRPAIPRKRFMDKLAARLQTFEKSYDRDAGGMLEQPEQQEIAHDVLRLTEQATPPLSRWEFHVEKPISFIVMPVFALMNAGVLLNADAIAQAWRSDLSSAILVGLLIGKPVGIAGGIALGKLLRIVEPPDGLGWATLAGIGLLGGIGFTMSLFIAGLSFGGENTYLEIAKQGVIATSLLSGLAGFLWLRFAAGGNTLEHS